MACCPNCASARIHLSKRKGLVETVILTLLFVRPFRCERCDERFFRWSFAAKPNSSRAATT
jgi:hypothetical protein